jgi:hypothetical protein
VIATWFPDRTVNKLTKTAIAHAAELAFAFDHAFAFAFAFDLAFDLELSHPPNARLVVNMVRHEDTDDDDDQSGDRHGEACDAIATTDPWMVGECAGQKAHRMASDTEWDLQVAAQAAQDAEWKEARRRLEVCAGLVAVAVAA